MAARARRSTAAQSPAASASLGVSHEPPTHSTFDSARNSPAVDAAMPPVGQKRTCGNGPAKACSIATPPAGTAGKNLKVSSPASSPAITSDAVCTPGSSGTP